MDWVTRDLAESQRNGIILIWEGSCIKNDSRSRSSVLVAATAATLSTTTTTTAATTTTTEDVLKLEKLSLVIETIFHQVQISTPTRIVGIHTCWPDTPFLRVFTKLFILRCAITSSLSSSNSDSNSSSSSSSVDYVSNNNEGRVDDDKGDGEGNKGVGKGSSSTSSLSRSSSRSSSSSILIHKVKFHFGTQNDIHSQLQSYGIPVQLLPITASGKIRIENHNQWMATIIVICYNQKKKQQQQQQLQLQQQSQLQSQQQQVSQQQQQQQQQQLQQVSQ